MHIPDFSPFQMYSVLNLCLVLLYEHSGEHVLTFENLPENHLLHTSHFPNQTLHRLPIMLGGTACLLNLLFTYRLAESLNAHSLEQYFLPSTPLLFVLYSLPQHRHINGPYLPGRLFSRNLLALFWHLREQYFLFPLLHCSI
jgi:hypothetical protein